MDSKYDLFARYTYITPENESIIRQYITDPEDIEYIISQKIKPEQFMDFITLQGFYVKNTLYYEVCKMERPMDNQAIVNFVNMYRPNFKIQTFDSLIASYTYESLAKYYDEGYPYFAKDVKSVLVEEPDRVDLILKDMEIILDYKPVDLVAVNGLPFASIVENEEAISLREEAVDPLQKMVDSLGATNQQTAGGLILTSGFISYESQVGIYSKNLLTYGADKFSLYTDYPGRSEQQLGYTATFKIAGLDSAEAIESSEQYKWLSQNAHKYGFIFRYPKGKEGSTGKMYQPLTLRYVGKENAQKVFESGKTFNEIEAKDE